MKFRRDKEDEANSTVNNGTSDEHQNESTLGAGAQAASTASSEPESYVRELDYDLIPEPGRTEYFKPLGEGGAVESVADVEAEQLQAPAQDGRLPEASSDRDVKPEVSSMAGAPDASEERIVFDAWDNRQVKSVNKKAQETVGKAVLDLGDHTVDTVFKGNYMAVLNPRSKEFKRFRKLWKHPELMIDSRRWTESTGAAAVRRHCLAEGIDVSSLRGSHFIELYYVKDPDLLLILAEEANTKEYNVRQLRQAIGDLREGKDDLDSGKAIIKTLDQALPLLEEPELVALCADKERLLEELSKAERKKILTLVKKHKPGLNEWKKLVETLEGILNELETE